jgi:hypothetical protein
MTSGRGSPRGFGAGFIALAAAACDRLGIALLASSLIVRLLQRGRDREL